MVSPASDGRNGHDPITHPGPARCVRLPAAALTRCGGAASRVSAACNRPVHYPNPGKSGHMPTTDLSINMAYLLQVLRTLISINSVLPYEQDVAVFVAEELRKLGLEPEWHEVAPGR